MKEDIAKSFRLVIDYMLTSEKGHYCEFVASGGDPNEHIYHHVLKVASYYTKEVADAGADIQV